MTMRGVLRVGDVGLRVLDLEESRKHYGDRMGLIETGRDEDGATYYKCWDEHDAYSLVLRQADRPGMDWVAFKVYDDATLTELEGKLGARGLEVTSIPAGVHARSGRRIQFALPSGHTLQLFADKEQVGNGMPTRNPGVIPDEDHIRGMRIIRMDHILLGGEDIDGAADIFHDVFDFNISERLIDAESEMNLAIFLSGSTKPHDIAFVRQPNSDRFHHVSFLLESYQDVYHAADLLGKYRIPVDVGPTRHGVTRGATVYFFDPSGNRNEVFTGGYVHYPDTPTLVWDTSELGQATFAQDNTPRESFLNVLT